MAMKGSNVVNVTSIDEERLKFRVTVVVQGGGVGLGANPAFGEYPVAMPIHVEAYLVDAEARPAAVEVKHVLVPEDEPLVFHLVRLQAKSDLRHLFIVEGAVEPYAAVGRGQRRSLPVGGLDLFHRIAPGFGVQPSVRRQQISRHQGAQFPVAVHPSGSGSPMKWNSPPMTPDS